MSTRDEEIDEEDVDVGPVDPEVREKYRASAEIANRVLAEIIRECKPDKKIVDLCQLGDSQIEAALKGTFNKKGIEKGIAFPTCISVNNCAGHYSPLSEDVTTLKEGDVVKIDLGVQIDGRIAVTGQTIVVNSSGEVVTGRKADVICAAHFAAECALKLLRPGHKNTEITEIIEQVANIFHCNPVEGVLSHQMKQFVIDANKVIINKASLEHKVDEITFEENEVYCIDIVMSTGDGKTREMEAKTTVFKRAVEQSYLLKMKASRYIFNEINKRFPTLPFTLRAFDEKRARLGIVECIKHDLVHPYPVLYERSGEYVARFAFTALVLPTGTVRLTQTSVPYVKSEYSITPAIKSILSGTIPPVGGAAAASASAPSTSEKKKRKKKKKKAAAASASAAAPEAAAPKADEGAAPAPKEAEPAPAPASS